MIESIQDHASTAGSGDPHVQYEYDYGLSGNAASHARLKKVTYPGGGSGGRAVQYKYGTTDGIDDRLSRVYEITNSAGTTTFARYTYLGASTAVKVEHPDVTNDGLTLNYDVDGDRKYSGFDRLGRVVDQKWMAGATIKDRFGYDYDMNSNRTYRQLAPGITGRPTTKDEHYVYDGLNRLTKAQRGTATGSPGAYTGFGSESFTQAFTLDAVGNWSEFKVDDNGAGGEGNWELEQTRAHNDVNEIDTDNVHGDDDDAITGSPNWEDPKYDAAGNATNVPRPSSPTTKLGCLYDAWNRVVSVFQPFSSVGLKFRYDGLHRRIAKLNFDWGGHWDRTDYYHTVSWQVIEECFAADQEDQDTVATDPKYQYVWDIRYIDAAVLRDENTDTDGDCDDERLYYTHDAQFNVTALVNTGDGTIAERYVYDPYGKVTIYNPTWSATVDWDDSEHNEILYCGYRYDHESRLYHVRYRMYHPTLGRWLQRDSAEYVDGMSLCEYLRGDPVGRVDPTGLQAETIGPPPAPEDRLFPPLPTDPWEFSDESRIRMQLGDTTHGYAAMTFETAKREAKSALEEKLKGGSTCLLCPGVETNPDPAS
ncbi:MAG: RHS repeat-associated core domain-containing protein, partial [Phycisphaerae bacterium]